MSKLPKYPPKLYKYRDLSARTLDMVVADVVFFADPSTFNDPMDTRPSMDADIDEERLGEVLRKLVDARFQAEMKAAARKISYSGPKTLDHIHRRSQEKASSLLAHLADAVDPGYGVSLKDSLANDILRELLHRYEEGIFSLATRNNCPLMWSHYADQHRGICIGYSVPDDMKSRLQKIRYGGSRLVRVSDVEKMLEGDKDAKARVDSSVLFRKAFDWRYEREWRLVGLRGAANSDLELEELVFGMRCPDSVRHAVAKALEGRCRPVRLYEIREVPGTFKLKRFALNHDEIAATYPRRARDILDAFDRITD